MTKDEFLRILDRKLQVINERERRDIIDEYRTHIEMKVQEGKTEAEAIEDFGDIDELVNEILDAYKINTKQVNNSFDHKFNSFMDDLFEGFQRFLGSFTSLNVEDVVRLVFEILTILILLLILRIPFALVSSLGYELLHSLIGFGIGNVLAHIWELIISIAYIVLFIVVFVNLIGKRVQRYRQKNPNSKSVFDDFKDSVHKMNRSHAQDTIYDETKDASYQKEQYQEHPYQKQEDKEQAEFEQDQYQSVHRESDSIGEGVGSLVSVLMKIFFCLMMIPVIGIMVGLCCALGAMVILSLEGLTLFGAYFIVIGGIILVSAFLTAMYRVLWKRG